MSAATTPSTVRLCLVNPPEMAGFVSDKDKEGSKNGGCCGL